jgi:hypothetical protein
LIVIIMQVPKILFVALVSHAFLKSASAVTYVVGSVGVYTSLVEWQTAIDAISATGNQLSTCIDDFSGPDIPLVAGRLIDVGLFDAFVDSLDGTTQPLGRINGEFRGMVLSGGPSVSIGIFDNAPIIGFAGDWNSTTNGSKLTVEINNVYIKFGDFLTSAGGDGFLGFIAETSQYNAVNPISVLFFDAETQTSEGEFSQVFQVDNFRAAGRGTCPPSAAAAACPTSGCQGDPHFKTWRGQHFDYHGECDLVLIHSSAFGSGLGLDVHIRTKIRHGFSFISGAALRIGKDLLEVESQGVYWLNGVLSADLPNEFSGFAFSHTQPTDKQHAFEVYLGGRERIKVKTYKDFVSVLIEQGGGKHFGDSVGLMGDFRMGHMIARDGKTVLDDANAFGQEWQVRDTEPSLFHTVRLPQHPQQVCTLPPPKQANQLRRRLEESSSVSQLAAEKACEHWGEGKDDCVFDVLTTGDLEMAVEGAY